MICHWILRWVSLAALSFAPLFAFDSIALPNGDFEGKKGLKEYSTSESGVVIQSNAESDTKVLAIGGGSWLEVPVPVGEAIQAEGMDPELWYGRLTLDLAQDSERGMRWTVGLYLGEGKDAFHTWKCKTADAEQGRISLALSPKKMKRLIGETPRLRMEVKGKPDQILRLEEWAFERFHGAPTRKMLGKPNGFNGPDLIASGALGFYAITEHNCHAFPVVTVLEEGPAAKADLQVGDLIVEIEGQPLRACSLAPGEEWFEHSHEATLGRAVAAAVDSGQRKVELTVLRNDKRRSIAIRHLHDKAHNDTVGRGPLDPKLREDLIAWTVRNQQKNGSWKGTDAVNPALGGLALLATRDRQYKDAIERCRDFILKKNPKPSEMTGLAFWTIGFHGMFLAEYYLATGDKDALAWVEEAVLWLPSATHTSKWGTQAFGHGPDGLPYDDKALTAPATHLLVLDALARKCGIESKVWEHVQPYMEHAWSNPAEEGHGGMGYNGSHRDKQEFWSRSGLTALAETLRGGDARMAKHLCLFMEERHTYMLNSHAYGEPGAALGLLGLAMADRPAFERILPKWRWRFLNAWQPGYGLRWSTPHMGSPYMGEDEIVNLAYALLSGVENKGLVMAGGQPERWLR
jgi:hypothetical protein